MTRKSTKAGTLYGGVAQVDITPPLTMPLCGYYYERFPEDVHDNLYAKTIFLRLGKAMIVVVECDLIWMEQSITHAVRTWAQEQFGIPGAHILIGATHTHTSPWLQKNYNWFVAKKIMDSILLAYNRQQPVSIMTGIGSEKTLPKNRRYRMKNGTVQTNPGKLNPQISTAAGPVDPDVGVVHIVNEEGLILAAWTNFALHTDTNSTSLISADYPCFLHESLRKVYGEHVVSIFSLGCCGDINHWDVFDSRSQYSMEESARIGRTLAAEVLSTSLALETEIVSALRGVQASVKLALYPVAGADITRAKSLLRSTVTKPEKTRYLYEKTERVIRRHWAEKILRVAEMGRDSIETEVQVLAIGDMAIVGFPQEMFCAVSLDIKRRSPFAKTFVVSLTNDYNSDGYVPTRAAYREGGYEAVYSRCAPGSSEKLTRTALRLLNQLSGPVHTN